MRISGLPSPARSSKAPLPSTRLCVVLDLLEGLLAIMAGKDRLGRAQKVPEPPEELDVGDLGRPDDPCQGHVLVAAVAVLELAEESGDKERTRVYGAGLGGVGGVGDESR